MEYVDIKVRKIDGASADWYRKAVGESKLFGSPVFVLVTELIRVCEMPKCTVQRQIQLFASHIGTDSCGASIASERVHRKIGGVHKLRVGVKPFLDLFQPTTLRSFKDLTRP